MHSSDNLDLSIGLLLPLPRRPRVSVVVLRSRGWRHVPEGKLRVWPVCNVAVIKNNRVPSHRIQVLLQPLHPPVARARTEHTARQIYLVLHPNHTCSDGIRHRVYSLGAILGWNMVNEYYSSRIQYEVEGTNYMMNTPACGLWKYEKLLLEAVFELCEEVESVLRVTRTQMNWKHNSKWTYVARFHSTQLLLF